MKYTYFIRGEKTGLIKIGSSENPEKRLKDMQTGSPDRLVLLGAIEYSKIRECFLHSVLKENHAHGEWFNPTPRLIAFIEGFVVKKV